MFVQMTSGEKGLRTPSHIAIAALLLGTFFIISPNSLTTYSSAETVNQPRDLLVDGEDCAGAGDVLFFGNFECGTPEEWSPWDKTFLFADHAFQRDTTNVRQGSFAGRFEVRDGDVNPANGTERAELGHGPTALNGDTRFYAFSTFFQATWAECDTWCVLSQWPSGVNQGPPLVFALNGDVLRTRLRSGECEPGGTGDCEIDIINVLLSSSDFRATTGMWHDWMVDAKWHYDEASGNHDGHIRVYHRLEGDAGFDLVAEDTGIPTLKNSAGHIGQAVVQRIGIYRQSQMVPTSIMWHDSACVATTLSGAQSCLP